MIDLGMAAKPRPAVILSVPESEVERAVVSFVARTTQIRGGRFEVEHRAPHFLPGVFDAQSVGTVPTAKLMRRLGRLADRDLVAVEDAVARWLGLDRRATP